MGKARPWGASFPPLPGQVPASSVHLWGRGPGASILRFIPGHLQPCPSPHSTASGVAVAPPEQGWQGPHAQLHSPLQNKFHPFPSAPGSKGQERSPHPGSPEYLVVPSPAPIPTKNPKRQRSGEHGPDVLNLGTRPRKLEEFPGVPGAPHARHPAAGDARAGGYLLSTSCQSPREARPLGTAGPVRGDVCQEGGTGLGALPGRDGTGHMRRAGCVPTLGLIPIFLHPHHLGEPVSGVYPGV